MYAPSSSLLQGKHLPFSPSPLRLNIFHLSVILSLTQLYRYTPEIFLFSTATFKYKYRAPSDELDKNIQRKSHFLLFSHWNGYSHFNATFNNILVISWRSVLLVEETGIARDNHRPAASHWQTLSHKAVSSTPHLMITTTTVPYQSVSHVSVKNRGECTS
jgi:hypothetical protein